MCILTENIEQIVAGVWEQMLALPAHAGGSGVGSDRPKGAALTGCVQITGSWRGAVTLVCTEPMVRQAASIMFAIDESKIELSLMQDALGELTNMMAGNLKSLLAEPCFLSLPTVVEGSDYGLRISDSRLLASVPFECLDRSFEVSVKQAVNA